jgi:hypothetical protein
MVRASCSSALFIDRDVAQIEVAPGDKVCANVYCYVIGQILTDRHFQLNVEPLPPRPTRGVPISPDGKKMHEIADSRVLLAVPWHGLCCGWHNG